MSNEQTLRAVLEAINYTYGTINESDRRKLNRIVTIARAALAAPAETVKPVAWLVHNKVGGSFAITEPVDDVTSTVIQQRGLAMQPLYLATPTEPEQNFCPRCGKRSGMHTCTPPECYDKEST